MKLGFTFTSLRGISFADQGVTHAGYPKRIHLQAVVSFWIPLSHADRGSTRTTFNSILYLRDADRSVVLVDAGPLGRPTLFGPPAVHVHSFCVSLPHDVEQLGVRRPCACICLHTGICFSFQQRSIMLSSHNLTDCPHGNPAPSSDFCNLECTEFSSPNSPSTYIYSRVGR